MTIEIMSKDACNKAIRQIARIGAKLELHIHRVGVSALAHVRDHGDTTVATNLLNALPKGQRVKALAYWFGHFSNKMLTLTQGKDGNWGAALDKKRMESDFRVEEAAACTFAELTAEKNPGQTFTVEQLLKKLKSWANEEGFYEDGVTPKVAPEARDLAAQLYASLDAPKVKPDLKLVA